MLILSRALLLLALLWSTPAGSDGIANFGGLDAGFTGGVSGAGGDTSSGNPVSNACINSSGTTITFTAQGVGGANPNRITVVTINWSDSTAAGTAELTAMTVGGISMLRSARASGDDQNSNSEIWSVANPTGTSANVVATFSTAVDGVTIEVYSLIGYQAVVATTAGTTSVSQAYTNKQLAIAAGSRTTNVSTALSNMTNDYSSACGTGLWGVHASQKLSNNGTLTSTISPTSSNPKIVLAIWALQAPTCAEATTFLARTSGLTATYISDYQILICGLVTDGVWSKLDVLYMFATQNSTTALLNLVSSSFTGVTNGSPPFTANRGFTGTLASTTVFIDTQFNPTSGSPHFIDSSNHVSVWNVTHVANTGSAGACIGYITAGSEVGIYAAYTDGNSYYRPNTNNATAGVADAVGTGHYIASRVNGSTSTGDRNGSQVQSISAASASIQNVTMYVLSHHDTGSGSTDGSGSQNAGITIGGGLTPTDRTNLYNRERTWMTSRGVP